IRLIRHGLVEEAWLTSSHCQINFVEPLIATALEQQATSHMRRRLHRQATTLIDSRGRKRTDEETIMLAHHLLAGDLLIDHARVTLVGQAAQLLVARSQFADARELLLDLERTLREQRNDDQPGSTLPVPLALLLAEAFSRSGDLVAA